MKSTFDWRGAPETPPTKPAKQTRLYNGLEDARYHYGAITVVGQAQGQIDAHKLDATRRGGI